MINNNYFEYMGRKREKSSFYKVKENETGNLVFTSRMDSSIDNTTSTDMNRFEKSFIDYVDILYKMTVKGGIVNNSGEKYGIKSADIVALEFKEGNTLRILQLSNWSTYLTTNFDLSDVELPERTKKQLLEIHDFMAKKNIKFAEYVPLINDLLNNRVLPSLKENEFADFMQSYEGAKNGAVDFMFSKYLNTDFIFWIIYVISLPVLDSVLPIQVEDSFLLALITVAVLYVLYAKVKDVGGKAIIKKILDEKVKNYLEKCKELENLNKDALNDYSTDIMTQAAKIDINNSQFFVSLGRDLSILECYEDQELKAIELELLNLGREYLNSVMNSKEGSAIVGEEFFEEQFMKELSLIEAKINLTGKKLASKEDTTVNFIAENCELNSDGTMTLLPVLLDTKLTKGNA